MERARTGRALGAVAAGVAAGVLGLQTDWWTYGEPVDLLAQPPAWERVRGATVTREAGALRVRETAGACADGAACADAALEWWVPVGARFATVRAAGSGDAQGPAAWVRVFGVHGGTALAGALPAAGSSVLQVGPGPLRVQARYRGAQGELRLGQLEVLPTREHGLAQVARWGTWLGWLGLGGAAGAQLVRTAGHRRRGQLLALVLGGMWVALALPSFEWMGYQLRRAPTELSVPAGAVAPEAEPVGAAAPEVEPVGVAAPAAAPAGVSEPVAAPAGVASSTRSWRFRVDLFTLGHGVGFFALGALGVWARARPGALLAFAVGSECVQSVLPGRTAQLEDLAVNLGGLGLGAGLVAAVRATWRAWRPR